MIFSHHAWTAFIGGLFSCAHCLGMCGGFVLHLSREGNRRRMFLSQLSWHLGKLGSYLFLGAVAGFTGGYFQLFILRHGWWQNLLCYLAAAAMLFAGLSLLGLLPVRSSRYDGVLQGILGPLARRLFSTSSPGSALTLGVATGFLPCPIVLGFIAYALQTGSVPAGIAVMAGLSLGTTLPLLLLSGATRMTGWHLRRWAPAAGGVVLLLLALGTALRGSEFFHRFLGCPPKPVLHESSNTAPHPTCAKKSDGIGSDD